MNELTARIKGKDRQHGLYRNIRADSSTHALEVTDYEHHEIHSGKRFFVEDVTTLAINAVFDLQWTTPDLTEWAHFTFELAPQSETEWYIYEGATINTAGSVIDPINNNRNSSNTPNALLASISNTSVSNANSDTTVAGSTQIAHGIIGSGKNGGVATRNKEIILKQNTIYCMRAVAVAAGYANFYMGWYEHTDKD